MTRCAGDWRTFNIEHPTSNLEFLIWKTEPTTSAVTIRLAGTLHPKARWREQVHEVARFKHLSLRTEETYWGWIVRYLRFHRRKAAPHPDPLPIRQTAAERGEGVPTGGWRHPREMGAVEMREFLVHLAVERRVAEATQNQALNALVFLYREVLDQGLGPLGEFERPHRGTRLPVVLTHDEIGRLLEATPARYRLFLALLYGTGIRLLEGLRLRVHPVR